MNKIIFAFLVLFISVDLYSCKQSAPDHSTTALNDPSSWSSKVIWYQIFVERFYNGDTTNDPTPENINIPPIGIIAPEHWSLTPWTHNWYEREPWAKNMNKSFNFITQYRRYGGDLRGVIMKLDYLNDLGISAIYLNPINDAPSMHKYDARNYQHVDVNFGPDPEGDNLIIASENPSDPSTWKWTSADSLFLELIEEAHHRKIKIIMDYSWNHTGVMFWAWQDILKNQEKSPFADWYDIKSFDNPTTPQNEFSYSGWLGNRSLPELKKVNVTTDRKAGNPYEGDINSRAKEHIYSVSKRWLAPDGDPGKGIDGFRLDVADQVGMVFWRDYRKFVRSIKPDAYLVGEIWWQQWPDKMMNPVPYTLGDIFDAVMFYQVYGPARSFFAKTDFEINAQQFRDSLETQWNRLLPANRYAMMNVSSSHDSPRLLTCFNNPNKYKYQSTPNDNNLYKTGKPDEDTYKRLRLYLVHLFTSIGAPQVWNGEEMGMWGADDPDCRKPLWWKEFSFEPETRNNYQPGVKEYDSVGFNTDQYNWYRKLINIRNNNPVLADGQLEFIIAEGKKLGYKRFNNSDEIYVYFNLDKEAAEFELPVKGTYTELLTDQEINSDKISLESLSSVVLKRVK